MSVELPGVNEMIACTGLVGYAWPNACTANAVAANARHFFRIFIFFMVSLLEIAIVARRGYPVALGGFFRALARFSPVLRRGFRLGERLCVLESWSHRRRGAREHLVMIDVQQPQPALLPHGEPDHAAQLDQFLFVEVPVHPLPECVVG